MGARLPILLQYPVTVLNLPSVVESYKTLDDVNLVKTTDIGQVCKGSTCCGLLAAVVDNVHLPLTSGRCDEGGGLRWGWLQAGRVLEGWIGG